MSTAPELKLNRSELFGPEHRIVACRILVNSGVTPGITRPCQPELILSQGVSMLRNTRDSKGRKLVKQWGSLLFLTLTISESSVRPKSAGKDSFGEAR